VKKTSGTADPDNWVLRYRGSGEKGDVGKNVTGSSPRVGHLSQGERIFGGGT